MTMRGPLSHVHREQRDTEDRREKPRMWCSTVGGIVTLTLSLFLAPLCADAQSLAKVPRIGVISPVSPVDLQQSPFLQELRKLGYVVGQNILIDWRSYGGHGRASSRPRSRPGPASGGCPGGVRRPTVSGGQAGDQYHPHRRGSR